jgi:hypothetical protein
VKLTLISGQFLSPWMTVSRVLLIDVLHNGASHLKSMDASRLTSNLARQDHVCRMYRP